MILGAFRTRFRIPARKPLKRVHGDGEVRWRLFFGKELLERLRDAEGGHKGGRARFSVGRDSSGSHGAEKEVFRGVLRVDEFHRLNAITGALKKLGAYCVRRERGEPFLYEPEAEERLERGTAAVGELRKLRVDLMLAARNGQNRAHSPFHGVVEREIGRGVACVEGHHDVGRAAPAVRRDVAHGKRKPRQVQLGRHPRAVFDDVLLQVQPEHLAVDSLDFPQKIVDRKSQIRFPGAEIDDAKGRAVAVTGAAFHHVGKDVVDNFEEAVYLPEFVVLRRDDFSFGGHHAEADEERHGNALLDYSVLALRADVLHDGGGHCPLNPRDFSLLVRKDLDFLAVAPDYARAERLSRMLVDEFAERGFRHALVEHLLLREEFREIRLAGARR